MQLHGNSWSTQKVQNFGNDYFTASKLWKDIWLFRNFTTVFKDLSKNKNSRDLRIFLWNKTFTWHHNKVSTP